MAKITQLTKDIMIQLKTAGIAIGNASELVTTDGTQISIDITSDIPEEKITTLFEDCKVIKSPYGPKKENGNFLWEYVYCMLIINLKNKESLNV